ncbi:MAG: glycosyltransferase [Candidatus Moranbacteria bacterium]|nr:glycosyltransferase [Candidatus Moranbacteria bacterium]
METKKIMAGKSFDREKEAKAAVYAGISVSNHSGFYVAVKGFKPLNTRYVDIGGKVKNKDIKDWLKRYAKEHKVKFVAAGFSGVDKSQNLLAHLWLKMDIVPFIYEKSRKEGKRKAESICFEVKSKFNRNNLIREGLDEKGRVEVSNLVRLKDYQKTASGKNFNYLIDFAEEFKKRKLKMVFVNSTAFGGGVSLMRHALVRLYRLLGVDVEWRVIKGNQDIFNITKKKFHNILQAIAPPYIKLTAKDKKLFNEWSRHNAKKFSKLFKKCDVVVIDDPQPSGMIPYIQKLNPRVKIIFRSHIQVQAKLIDEEFQQQLQTWKFIWKNAKKSDVFVSHPIEEFVPELVPREKTAFMPATTDPLDGLNKELTENQIDYYLNLLNSLLKKTNQTPLDLKRPYIVQIARFDPSKGIPHVIESYRKLRRKLEKDNFSKKETPQLVIAGNGAIDDPEGHPIFADTMEMMAMDDYQPYAQDIKVIRLPHCDQLLNALSRRSFAALQLSLKEGFEVKVSEHLAKGVPVIAYRTGGIPLQIEDNVTGFLVNPGNTAKVAKHIYELLKDKKLHRKISQNAKERVREDCFTVNNAYKWLYLALKLTEEEKFHPGYQNVRNLIKDNLPNTD